jgi:hypothetical protein
MEDQKIPTLVIGISNNHIYQYHGEEVYENLTTDAPKRIGKIKDEDAKRYFKIPLRLNQMVMENPKLVDLIKVCKTNYSQIFPTKQLNHKPKT